MVLSRGAAACAADERPQPFLTKNTFFTELGFYTGVGYGEVVEGPTIPIMFIIHMGKDMQRWFPSLQGHRGTLSFFLEPNFNPSGTPKQNVDFGLGIGLKYAYPVNDTYSVYVLGSVGPHYITLITQDQAQGFLFADTIGVGMSYAISPGSAINVEYRLRHLSNGGIREPNYGIEYHTGLIGFTLFY